MYLAFHCPHWPLHTLPEDIEKYKDTYKDGWQAIRESRYQRMKEMKLLGNADNFLSPRQFNDSWEENPTKE